MQNNYEPQYVVIAQTKEKTLKKLLTNKRRYDKLNKLSRDSEKQ